MGRRLIGSIAALALGAAACSGSSGDASNGVAASTTAPPAYTPTFTAGPCDDVVPADPRVTCGVLTVPVDRAHPDAGNVTMPVATIKASSPNPQPDPIVYFSGGPGGPGRTDAGFFLDKALGGGDRDVIVFDQRGTGQSTPSLDCPEIVEPIWAALGSAGDPITEGQTTAAAVMACRARLVSEGVDLDAYDTPTTAADVEDLRIALGIDQWNLLGVSYGTTVALEVAREFPDHVRSVTIDSAYPPDVPADGEARVDEATRAFGVLAAGCAADAGCASRNGDVEASIQAVVDDWNATPYELTIPDPTTAQDRHLVITGNDVVAGLWNAMYDSSLIGLLPSLPAALLERGDVAAAVVTQLATSGLVSLAGSAEGVAVGVDCADRERLGGTSFADEARAQPRFDSLLTLGGFPTCDQWGVQPDDPAFNAPVVSSLPGLFFADEYDPTTPPADTERAAQGFADGTVVHFPGLGHGATFVDSDCPRTVFAEFVHDPTSPPSTACVDQMGPPAWQ